MTRAGGRPAKLSPKIQARICQLIRDRVPEITAALSAGVSERAYFYWKEWGEEGKSEQYVQFLQAVKKALADAEIACINQVAAAAQDTEDRRGQWQAAAWMLERRSLERWARREMISQEVRRVDEAGGKPLTFEALLEVDAVRRMEFRLVADYPHWETNPSKFTGERFQVAIAPQVTGQSYVVPEGEEAPGD